ncbi:MAG: hypothetical protein KGN39_03430 [Betaproteobacteria bacterium]|nr:hypothetical protein [Betaproteobacteria bacterium]
MGFFDWLLGAGCDNPEDGMLEAAIEQVMAATDPRLKALAGARERLAPAVAHALDYARRISTEQPPCIEMRPENWSASPVLRALFAQPAEVAHTLSSSPDLREFLGSRRAEFANSPDPIFCLVATTPVEHATFGTAMEGEMLRREVEQRSVSFKDFRLVGFSPSQADLALRIRDMVLEALVLEALHQVTANRARGQSLEAEHGLLAHRLGLMVQSRAGLNGLACEGCHHQDIALLRRQLAENEAELAASKSAGGWLEEILAQLVRHLSSAETSLPIHPVVLWLTAMNIAVAPGSPDADPITLMEIVRTVGPRRLAFPAAIPRGSVAPQQIDIAAAMRLL